MTSDHRKPFNVRTRDLSTHAMKTDAEWFPDCDCLSSRLSTALPSRSARSSLRQRHAARDRKIHCRFARPLA